MSRKKKMATTRMARPMPAKKKIGMASLMLLLLLPFGDLEVISVMSELKMLETDK